MYEPGKLIPWQPGETVLRCMPDGSYIVEKVASDICIPPKRLYAKDILEIFKKSYTRKNIDLELRPGILPKDTLEFMAISVDEQIGYIVIIKREGCIRPFCFVSQEGGKEQRLELNVGYPRLLFKFIVIDNTVMSLSVMAAKTGLIKDDTPLYLYPYTNVFETGAACLGRYKYPKIKELRHLSSYPDVFYEMENNGDIYLYKSVMPIKEILVANKEKPFDEELLIPSGQTYSKFADRELKRVS
jgi:hypothetical protein